MTIEGANPLALLAALGGGFVSFLSPCVLPMVPAYLSIVTGLDVATIKAEGRAHYRSIATTTGLFVAGFGLVFVLLGLSATALGQRLVEHQELLTRVSGAVMLAMALFLLGSLFVQAPWLYQEKRFQPQLGRFGTAAPFVAGLAFGFGWTPCLGPVLASIFTVAATQDQVWQGAALLAAYAVGLGVPFLLSGLLLGRLERTFTWFKRHARTLVAVSASMLAFFGVLLVFNQFAWLSGRLIEGLDAMGLDWVVELG